MAKLAIRSSGCGGGEDGASSKAGKRTTFVRADSNCFRDLVQRLTGPPGHDAPAPAKSPAPRRTQRLHERRKYKKPKTVISKVIGIQFQPASPEPKMRCSPPILGATSPGGVYGPISWSCPSSPSSGIQLSPPRRLQGSPVPVGSSNKRGATPSEMELNPAGEEKAIKEKRFYLHPSPRSKPRLSPEPEMLTLFLLTSPATANTT